MDVGLIRHCDITMVFKQLLRVKSNGDEKIHSTIKIQNYIPKINGRFMFPWLQLPFSTKMSWNKMIPWLFKIDKIIKVVLIQNTRNMF